MGIYQKRPVDIEAFQWTGTIEQVEDPEWAVEAIKNDILRYEDGEMFIRTTEGVMTVSSGDWIIKGVKGELYPCKPDIFEQTYRNVSTPLNRVIVETQDLADKIDKLRAFLRKPEYFMMEEPKRVALEAQLQLMNEYERVLRYRISNWH